MSTYTINTTWKQRLFAYLRDGANIDKFVDLFSDPLQDTVDVCDYLLDSDGIDNAAGVWLDAIGELIGVKRPLEQETKLFIIADDCDITDLDNDHGFEDDSDASKTTGGWLVDFDGLPELTAAGNFTGALYSDENYRFLIKQKASSYRRRMTRANLFNYLFEFGSRCKLNDDTTYEVEINPQTYYKLNEFEKWYTSNKGFRPAGIRTVFKHKNYDGDQI